ncbi:MAG: Txe/YoeB family addiction module toxin [Clostridia bacterium]
MYEIVFTRKAQKDKALIKQAGLDDKVKALLSLMMENPLCNPPEYEKLSGDLKGCYSRRINLKHRLVYEVYEKEKTVKVLSMWSHYGD